MGRKSKCDRTKNIKKTITITITINKKEGKVSLLQGYVTEELNFFCIVEHKICFKIDFSKINEFKIQNRVKKNKTCPFRSV